MSDCILWTGRLTPDGYARRGRTEDVHRSAWIEAHGPIPAGFELDHVCHTADATCIGGSSCIHRRCINVAHLELVSHRENTLRGRSFAAVNARKAQCEHGHEFTPSNTYIRPNGHRDCRTCIRARVRSYKARKAAA